MKGEVTSEESTNFRNQCVAGPSGSSEIVPTTVTKLKKGPYDQTAYLYVRVFCELTARLQEALPSQPSTEVVLLTEEVIKAGTANDLTNRDRHRDYALDRGTFRYALPFPDRKKANHIENLARRLWEPMAFDGKFEYFHSDPMGRYLGLVSCSESYESTARAMFGFMVRQAHTFYPEMRTMPFPFGKRYTARLAPSVKAQLIENGKGKGKAVEENETDSSMHQIVYDEQVLTMDDLPEYTALFPAPASTRVSVEEEVTKRHLASEQARKEIEIAKVNAEYKFRETQSRIFQNLFEAGRITFAELRSVVDSHTSSKDLPSVASAAEDCDREQTDESSSQQGNQQRVIPDFVFEFIDEWLQPGSETEVLTKKDVFDKYFEWLHFKDEDPPNRKEGTLLFTAAMSERGYVTRQKCGVKLTKAFVDGVFVPVYTNVKWNLAAKISDTGLSIEDLPEGNVRSFLLSCLQKTKVRTDLLPAADVETKFREWHLEFRKSHLVSAQIGELRDAFVRCKMGIYREEGKLESCQYNGRNKRCIRYVKWQT